MQEQDKWHVLAVHTPTEGRQDYGLTEGIQHVLSESPDIAHAQLLWLNIDKPKALPMQLHQLMRHERAAVVWIGGSGLVARGTIEAEKIAQDLGEGAFEKLVNVFVPYGGSRIKPGEVHYATNPEPHQVLHAIVDGQESRVNYVSGKITTAKEKTLCVHAFNALAANTQTARSLRKLFGKPITEEHFREFQRLFSEGETIDIDIASAQGTIYSGPVLDAGISPSSYQNGGLNLYAVPARNRSKTAMMRSYSGLILKRFMQLYFPQSDKEDNFFWKHKSGGIFTAKFAGPSPLHFDGETVGLADTRKLEAVKEKIIFQTPRYQDGD